MGKINKAYLLLGSNIEPRFDFITKAVSKIETDLGKVIGLSSVYESEPWGFEAHTKFLNCVVCIESELNAADLLNSILMIEKNMGRTRKEGSYASRDIDIDILYFNNDTIELTDLIIPHPRMSERRFTLVPLVEVAPDFEHPVFRKTNSALLDCCNDTSKVITYKAIQVI